MTGEISSLAFQEQANELIKQSDLVGDGWQIVTNLVSKLGDNRRTVRV